MFLNENRTADALNDLFDEQELTIIWAALNAYDVGPEDANPKLYAKLEKIRIALARVFE